MSDGKDMEQPLVFGLDIGTRNVVGTVGYRTEDQFIVTAQYIMQHDTRAMLDGQIHDIGRVSGTIRKVKEQLEKHHIRLFAAHLQGRNTYDKEDYQGGTAFLIGNEGKGLTDEAADSADCLIRIPMCGKVESLNAAMASGILMYEAARQRR